MSFSSNAIAPINVVANCVEFQSLSSHDGVLKRMK